jgi:hypothetical protein
MLLVHWVSYEVIIYLMVQKFTCDFRHICSNLERILSLPSISFTSDSGIDCTATCESQPNPLFPSVVVSASPVAAKDLPNEDLVFRIPSFDVDNLKEDTHANNARRDTNSIAIIHVLGDGLHTRPEKLRFHPYL